jgi:hypothetical protein
LKFDPPASPSNQLDYRHVTSCLAYLTRWYLANFLPGLASNSDPPNLHLPSTWDH